MTDSNNLRPLSRFLPVELGEADGVFTKKITLKSNLAGEPLVFTLNETLSTIVSTASLKMLNAQIGDLGQTISGVINARYTEEDTARWGTSYAGATVEPNQRVEVWEILGEYEVTDDGYEAINGGEVCNTHWRVKGATFYTDENEIPYCDIDLESLTQIAVDSKIDPKQMGSTEDFIQFYDSEYYWNVVNSLQAVGVADGYENLPDGLSPIFNGTRVVIKYKSGYLDRFFDMLRLSGYDFGMQIKDNEGNWTTVVSENFYLATSYIPAHKKYTKGESTWDIIQTLLSFNGLLCRFNRANNLIWWEEYKLGAPLDIVDIGTFGVGFKYSYTKEGVYSNAVVTGNIGSIDSAGNWIPTNNSETTVHITSQTSLNILNGEIVENTISVDADYLLADKKMIENYGKCQMKMAEISAKGISYDANNLPLSLEVGMIVVGSSPLVGTVSMLVNQLSRTTDVSQAVITTNISGIVYFDADRFPVMVRGPEESIELFGGSWV